MKPVNNILIASVLFLQLSCTSSKTVEGFKVSALNSNRKIEVYTTQQPNATVFITVDQQKTDQTFLGIGGAIKDASAEVFAKLSPKKQQEFLTTYYDKNKGIGYSLARTNINSCDFSSESYNYIQEGDKDLKTFSIDHDRKYRIPLLKKAIETAGGKLTLFVSPWSPPAFMKDNKDFLHGGVLLPEFAKSRTNYYAKRINETISDKKLLSTLFINTNIKMVNIIINA
jgi:glucosylceramidase